MKKMIVSLMTVLTVGSISAFAADPEPEQHVLDAFKKEFSAAKDVRWEKEEGYDKAVFGLAGHSVVAYYNSDAELEGCVRELFFEQLPLAVMTAVDKRFAESSVFAVKEIANANGTSYQLTLESKGKRYTARFAPDGNLLESKKIKL